MIQKMEKINKFSASVRSLTDAITELSSSMSIDDARKVLSILDPDVIQLMDNIALSFGTDLAIPVVPTNAQMVIEEAPKLETEVVVNEPTSTPATTTKTRKNISVSSFKDDDIRLICEVFVECGFTYQATLDACVARNILCTKHCLELLRKKEKWTNISNQYFTIKGNKIIPKSKKPEPVKQMKVVDGLQIPDGVLYDYLTHRLEEERGSIKRVYQKAVENNRDVTIFDVFNVKYDGKRDKPIRVDDIGVVVNHIAEKYQYSIPTISKVIKDNIDVVIDATQFHRIRKLAQKAGKTSHETERPLTRDKKLSDEEDHIANVLMRLELNLLQAYLHMRSTVEPHTMFEVYNVKKKIATVTDNDIRQITVNLQRSAGIIRPSDIADKIHEEIGVPVSKDQVINFIEWYDNNRANK